MSRRWLAGLFVVLALPVLLFIAMMVPLGETPDEPAHIVRADSLRHGEILGWRMPRRDGAGNTVMESGVESDWGLLTASFVFYGVTLKDKILTPALLAKQRAVQWQNKLTYFGVPNTAPYMPLFYAPAAAGLGIGKLAGLGPYDAVRTGRVINAVAYVAIGLAALLLAEYGQALLFVVLCLPMSLWLGGSFSQDALLIPTSVLAAALLVRPAPGRAYWIGGVLLACVIAAKPPYLPMAGLMLASALMWPISTRRWWCGIAGGLIAAVPALLWTAYTSKYVVADFIQGPPYHAGPLWPGEPGQLFATIDRAAQMKVLMHDPLLMLKLPLRTMQAEGRNTLHQMIGALGVLDLQIPPAADVMWWTALGLAVACAMLAAPARTPYWPSGAVAVGARVIAALCLVGTVFAVYLSQYLTWTEVGSDRLAGMQGRYLLPVLPFLPLALPFFEGFARTRIARPVAWIGAAGPGLAAAVGVAMIPALVLATYYRT